jgi:peptide/nickel transport system permease protein
VSAELTRPALAASGASGRLGLSWRAALDLGSRRTRTLWVIGLCIAFLLAVPLAAWLIGDAGLTTSLLQRNQPPSLAHPFGTDPLGRDMLTRTVHGLSLSLRVGLLAATISAVVGATLGLVAGVFGGKVDLAITWLVDLVYSLPHLVLLILIAFVMGGGLTGVIVGVALTHWPNLARIVRAEVLQVMATDYVRLSGKLGRSRWWIARHHLVPHLVPQFLVGTILLFPHAILHEAGITFVGIGLSPHTPAIGILLSESLRHLLTGYWWLGVLPGVALLIAVKAFDVLGENVRTLIDPKTAQE